MNGRDKRRKRAERAKQGSMCPNCLERGRHFVPASLGERGFYICESRYKKLNPEDFRIPMKFRTIDYRGRGG